MEDDSLSLSNLEQDILKNLSTLRDTWITWNNLEQSPKCQVVDSESVRDTSLVENIEQLEVPATSLQSHSSSKTRKRKVIRKRVNVIKQDHSVQEQQENRGNSDDLDILKFVRQHRDEVKRFVLQNEKNSANRWSPLLRELGKVTFLTEMRYRLFFS